MVQVTNISFNHDTKTAKVSLFADSKSDITSGMTINGVPEGYTLEMGSSALTADKDFGFLDSTGQWHW